MADTDFVHWSVNDIIRGRGMGLKLDFTVIGTLKDSEVCPPCAGAHYDTAGRCYYCRRKKRPVELLMGDKRFPPYDGTK